jgi:four helix bundle protein
MALVSRVYGLTRAFPREEIYGLTAQLRRAIVSVPSAVAEGNGRRRRRDYIRFVLVARSSLQEAETQLLVALDQGYLGPEVVEEALEHSARVGRMLNGLARALARLPPERPED